LVLVDLSLKNRNGIELIKVLKASHPELLMLVLSMHEESLYAERALRAGARGYIMKQEPAEKLLQFIRRILAGEVCISERATERVLKGLAGAHANAEESRLHELSDRELEVFQLMGQGLATREVAQRLSLSIKTIESHCESLKRKLNAPTTEDLRRMAAQRAQNPQTPDSSAKLRSPEAGI
jgi:DNA-binding NarL/FixJ family response regulator